MRLPGLTYDAAAARSREVPDRLSAGTFQWLWDAIAAPVLTHYDPAARTGRPHQAPSLDHILGTTRIGQDVYARLIYGARTAMLVAFFASFGAMIIGTILAHISGYFGGAIDWIIGRAPSAPFVQPPALVPGMKAGHA